MDISARLQQIEELVREAKSMPLSSSVLINKDEMLELLEAAQGELPEEVRQARWVVKDRDEVLAKARREGEAVIERANAERERIVSEEEVVRTANEEADRIVADAKEQARLLRLEAEDYVDAKLAQFEIALDRIGGELERSMNQVRRGRDKLRGITPAQEQFGSEDEEEDGA